MKIRFVLLASMRTGSNLLNSYLNQYKGIVCHGEAFNPTFIGLDPKHLKMLDLKRDDVTARDANNLDFLERIMNVEAEAVGLHMFPGHSEEILRTLLTDVSVKKLSLRRSIIHSFVSLQIAKKTDVWRVSTKGQSQEVPIEMRRIKFEPSEFEEYRNKIDRFWKDVFEVFIATGQSHHPVWYRHLNNTRTINSVVEFLGLPERKQKLKMVIERQNPEPLKDIVENWDEMVEYAKSVELSHQI